MSAVSPLRGSLQPPSRPCSDFNSQEPMHAVTSRCLYTILRGLAISLSRNAYHYENGTRSRECRDQVMAGWPYLSPLEGSWQLCFLRWRRTRLARTTAIFVVTDHAAVAVWAAVVRVRRFPSVEYDLIHTWHCQNSTDPHVTTVSPLSAFQSTTRFIMP